MQDSQGRIAVDVECVGCHYNLRGLVLTDHAACPECGLAVAQSIGKDRLWFADLDWLRSMDRGGRFLAYGVRMLWAFIGVSVVFIVLTFLMPSTPVLSYMGLWIVLTLLNFLLALVSFVLCVIGWCLLTKAEPAVGDGDGDTPAKRESRFSSRRLLRLTSCLVGLSLLLPLLFIGVDEGDELFVEMVFQVTIFSVIGLGTFSAVFAGQYQSNLARRVPSRSLMKKCQSTRWLPVTMLFTAVFFVFPQYYDPLSNTLPAGLWMVIYFVSMIGFFVTLYLLLNLSRSSLAIRKIIRDIVEKRESNERLTATQT